MDGSAIPESGEELERLRYPVGRFEPREGLSPDERDALVDDVAALPAHVTRLGERMRW